MHRLPLPGRSGRSGTGQHQYPVIARGIRASPADLHPGFRLAPTVILHRFGVDASYRAWRLHLLDLDKGPQAEVEMLQGIVLTRISLASIQIPIMGSGLSLASRNPPPLFGAGLIDLIPEDAIVALEKQKHPKFPDVQGRVRRLKSGRIGRFGWKASIASLRDVVSLSCAIELALELSHQHQSLAPLGAAKQPRGVDLTPEEYESLLAYVRHLPVPARTNPSGNKRLRPVVEGSALFESVGCASCHVPKVGPAKGIYSDLLLHDLGQQLADLGDSYNIDSDDSLADMSIRELDFQSYWRTPPLWGFRDSGPYLHDGRADNLEQAVAFHGGEAITISRAYFELRSEERLKIQAFLRSLVVQSTTE